MATYSIFTSIKMGEEVGEQLIKTENPALILIVRVWAVDYSTLHILRVQWKQGTKLKVINLGR